MKQVNMTNPTCDGIAGKCQDVSLPCPFPYISNKCAAGGNIRCCPRSAPAFADKIIRPGQPLNRTMCAGQRFPLVAADLHHINVNFGGARSAGKGCHSGLDLYTTKSKQVIAVANGTVTGIVNSTTVCACTGKVVPAIQVLIYHESMKQTINYAEITADKLNKGITVGATVHVAQPIGIAGACCLLHFELYDGKISEPLTWTPVAGKLATNPDGCVHSSLTTKPAALLDPRALLQCLKPAGASLLQDTGAVSEDAQQRILKKATPSGLGVGYIAAIVVVGVLVLAGVGVATVCVVRARARKQAETGTTVVNELYGTPMQSTDMDNTLTSAREDAMISARNGTITGADSTQLIRPTHPDRFKTATAFDLPAPNMTGAIVEVPGQHKCPHCEKTYAYATDVAAHIASRHQM